MTQKIKYYWPAILWAFFILIICNISLGKIGDSPRFFPGFDKLTHCGLFFTMLVLFTTGFIREQHIAFLSVKQTLIITLAIIFYGGVIELLQLYVFTWRTGDWNDLFADTVGICMGIFSILLTTRSIKYVKK